MEAGTRQRIIEIARELFAAQGYAGTSIADITNRLGTSKAAVYYHFDNKAAILSALVEEPLAAYARLTETQASAEDLLAAVIDTTASYLDVIEAIGNDPSARAVLSDLAQKHRSDDINDAILAALAGPSPSTKRRVRAHAAYMVAKHGAIGLTADGNLGTRERTELLAAALRALDA